MPRFVAPSLVPIALAALLAATAPAAPAAARAAGADGRFEQRQSRHFVLREDVAIDQRTGPRGANQFQREVLDALEAGYDVLDDALGLRPRRRIEVEIYDAAIFDARFAALFPFPAAGFYGGVIRVRGDVAVTPRLASTLHHELLHAALDAAAPSLAPPAWLNEGIAEWFAARVAGRPALDRGRRAALQRAAAQGALLPLEAISQPTLAALAPGSAPSAYLQATALVDEIAQRGGERALRTLLAQLFRHGDLDRALERAVGLDVRELEAATARSLGAD
ncbi:MAG: hypothetical protein DCC71_11455 [Proteobacteria bacterium]|nr:MAG: hypothetical protein DCC71_11455 [Pseudomonadota bacterium]